MCFTDEELKQIAAWIPVAPGFDWNASNIEARMRPILDRLSSDNRLALRIIEDGGGGLSNYFSFL